MTPKVFISYSWSSAIHQETVRKWAEQLISNGVEVILDQYDLKEGQDKYAFMEKMVTDASVTHVLIICDRLYSEKADARIAGVGTESQIISKEVYEKVEQSKFIPVVCEFDEKDQPFLPTFLKSRIWINFSNPESVNENWERLIRLLYGKPAHEKPQLGTPPAYVKDGGAAPANPAFSKFNVFKQAMLSGNKSVSIYRNDFIVACVEHADALRVRKRPVIEDLSSKILEDCSKLKQIRDTLIDWVVLEGRVNASEEFTRSLVDVLEKLLALKYRPEGLNQWNDVWFQAHEFFVYEFFLYLVASCLLLNRFDLLNEIFFSRYMMPKNMSYGGGNFEKFGAFHAEIGVQFESDQKTRYLSPAAELVKRQADRKDLPFDLLIEADLVIFFAALASTDSRWYPQMLLYARYGKNFPIFLRAEQSKYFKNLAMMTGIDDADVLRVAVKKGIDRLGADRWHDFRFYADASFWTAMNMDKLNTLK